jgi:hypothetical protein
MWSYASNPNTTLEIMVFLRDEITPKCHWDWEWHKTPTEKLVSYLVRVSERHPYLFSLEAINAPITKTRSPHHHRNHVISTSTTVAALSSAKVLMSHIATWHCHAMLPNYIIMLIWPHLPSVLWQQPTQDQAPCSIFDHRTKPRPKLANLHLSLSTGGNFCGIWYLFIARGYCRICKSS